MLTHIYNRIAELPAQGMNGERFFTEPLFVKFSPLTTHVFYAACPCPDGTLMVMDSNQVWHLLEATTADAPLMEALNQYLLTQQKAVA